jgi:hypothetical protein
MSIHYLLACFTFHDGIFIGFCSSLFHERKLMNLEMIYDCFCLVSFSVDETIADLAFALFVFGGIIMRYNGLINAAVD